MADTKISALPASTVPLAGTEVLPIVQSSSTKQVSVANLTAGRSFDALGMTLTSTDAGAAAAPLIDLYRDSASPAASDTLGEIEFNGEDSAGNKQAYGLIHASILSPTSTAEQGQLHFETATAGALTEKMIIGTSNLVINEIGSVFNVRIEGDTDANLFYTDATNSRVGIGTISPSTKLEVSGVATAQSFVPSAATIATNGLYLPAANSIGISTNSTNAIYIDSSRNVMIGTTTALAAGGLSFDRSNNSNFIRIVQNSLVDGATHQSFQTNGTQNGYIAVSAGVTIYSTTSDYRMKENVAKMTGALDKVALLNPVTFDWVDSKKSCQGFIAHELQAVVPECVFGTKDAVDEEGKPVLQGVDTSFLVATLTAAIQELKAEFDAYKTAHP